MNSTAFDPQAFEALRQGAWGQPLRWLQSTASTQDALEAWAREAGLAEGALCGAEAQTQGRGRQGRAWLVQPGQSLCFSLLLTPAQPSPALSLVLGLASAEALRSLGVPAELKWPNDVWVKGLKVAGLLLEQRAALCLAGCGLNVSQRAWPAELQGQACSLAEAGWQGPREALLAALLKAWEARYREWAGQGLGPLLAAWPGLDALRGQAVALQGPQGPLQGAYLGLDGQGRLRLRLPSGEEKGFVSGDVERLRGV